MIPSSIGDVLLGQMFAYILFVAVVLGNAYLAMSRPKGNSGAEQKSSDPKSENRSRPLRRGKDWRVVFNGLRIGCADASLAPTFPYPMPGEKRCCCGVGHGAEKTS